jgi:hypothetical protein
MLCKRTCPCTQFILISQYVMQENMSVYTIHPDFTICYAGEHVCVHNPSWFHICYAGEHVCVHNSSWFHNMLCMRTCPCTQFILISQYVMYENMSVYTIHPDFTICYVWEHVHVHNSSWFHNMLCRRTCPCTQFILISQYVMYENMSVYTIHPDFTICYVWEHVRVHNSSWFHNMLCMRTCLCTQSILISQYVMYENMSVYTIHPDFTICYAENMSVYTIHPDFTICYAWEHVRVHNSSWFHNMLCREHVRVHNSSWFHNMLCRRTCPCTQSILISQYVMQENMSVYTIHPNFTICYAREHVRVHNSSWFHNMLCRRTCTCTQSILISQYVMQENMSVYTIHPNFTICYAREHVRVHNSSWFHNMLCRRTCPCTQFILISQYVMYENMSVYTIHPDFTICYAGEHVRVHNSSWFHNMLCKRTCPCTQSILISQYVMQENMSVYTIHPDFTMCYAGEHVRVHNPIWFHNMLCKRTCPCTQFILISQYVMQENMSVYTIHPNFT